MGCLAAMLKTVAVVVALLAVSIGTIGKVKPELFMLVPHVGFVLWAITGHYVPPYFDHTAYVDGNFRTWVKDSDVIVATGAKSGTTWMCYCSHAIRTKGAEPMPYTDIMYTTPWMEMTQKPGMTWPEISNMYNTTVLPDGSKLKDYWDNKAYPFRVFKSHFGPIRQGGDAYADVLPVKEYPKVKYIALVRDFQAMASSIHSFFPKHRKEFIEQWGGFPPAYPSADAAAKDLLKGGNIYSLYFPYVRAWWELRNEPNVFLYHYNDATKDSDGFVKKLAKFLGVTLSDSEFAKVKEKCSFEHMKANSDLFDYRLPLQPGFGTIMQSGKFITKASATSRKVEISAEVQRELEAAINSELTDPELKQWSQNGGAFK